MNEKTYIRKFLKSFPYFRRLPFEEQNYLLSLAVSAYKSKTPFSKYVGNRKDRIDEYLLRTDPYDFPDLARKGRSERPRLEMSDVGEEELHENLERLVEPTEEPEKGYQQPYLLNVKRPVILNLPGHYLNGQRGRILKHRPTDDKFLVSVRPPKCKRNVHLYLTREEFYQ